MTATSEIMPRRSAPLMPPVPQLAIDQAKKARMPPSASSIVAMMRRA